MNKTKITTEKEELEVKLKIWKLQNQIDELQEPYDKYLETKRLAEKKKKWENRTFHNPKGTGIFYVIEVDKYSVRGIVLNGSYGEFRFEYSKAIGHTSYDAHFFINVSLTHEEFKDASEWRGVGKREYEQLVEKVEMLKEFFIDKNLSV